MVEAKITTLLDVVLAVLEEIFRAESRGRCLNGNKTCILHSK